MKFFSPFSRALYPLVAALAPLWLAGNACDLYASNSSGDKDEFRWEEAAREVATYKFDTSFIDSLHKAYSVIRPVKPLRVVRSGTFFKGETLVYAIGWGPFKAGYVILSTEPDPEHRVIRITGKALSNSFVGAFYRMRDYIVSTIDDAGLYPLFFEQHLREGKRYKSDGWILYDHDKNKLHVNDRNLNTVDAVPFVNDYLSVLYMVRTIKFAPGDTFSLPLYADKKVHRLFMNCKERKTIDVAGASVPCLLLEPKLVGDKGAFNKKDRLQVWLTDDERKMPVLIKSKINVGSITARLVQSTAPGAESGTTPGDAGAGSPASDNAAVPKQPDSGCASTIPDSANAAKQPDSGCTLTIPDSGNASKPPDSNSTAAIPDSAGAVKQPDSNCAVKQPDSGRAAKTPDSGSVSKPPDSADATPPPDSAGIPTQSNAGNVPKASDSVKIQKKAPDSAPPRAP